MARRTICAQLFSFAVLVAALFILPQAAQAHAGHAHAIHLHTQTQSPAADVSAVAGDVAEQRAEQRLGTALQGLPGLAGDSPCERGCCAQSSCAGCLSLVAPMPPLMQPPSLSAAIGLAANPRRTGIGGSSLRRPPKSFA